MDINVTIVDFGMMSEAIQRYQNTVKTIQGIIEAYQAIMKALQVAQVFTGGAASTVLAAVQQYINVMNDALANLNEIIQALQTKLDNYQAAHQEATNIASSIQQATWASV